MTEAAEPVTVAESLRIAQAAHQRYRALHVATGNNDVAGMERAIREAQASLTAAMDADPERADPAWSPYLAAMKMVALVDLQKFYDRYLNPPRPEAN